MQKKYQIFVSSTFRDLSDERQDTIRNILDLGHIPAGMELFPASDNEQLEYIKKIIDECDYYLLIVSGRYGSMDSEGVSFTDREYEYAVESKKPILAFIHGSPEKLSIENSDIDPRITARLKEFKERVSTGRLVKFWTTRETLALAVLKTLSKEIQENPQVGWIRGDAAAGEDLLQKINTLRNENDQLKERIQSLSDERKPAIEDIANLDEKYTIKYKTSHYYNGSVSYDKRRTETSWIEIFSIVGPKIFSPHQPGTISTALKDFLGSKTGYRTTSITIDQEILDQIKIQLIALKLIKSYQAKQINGGIAEYIEITEMGKKTLLEAMSVKTGIASSSSTD